MIVAPVTPRRARGLVPLDDTTTALIYARVSSDEQADEGVSIPAQLGECRRYNGRQTEWLAGDEFLDVESGTRADRDDYQRMLQTVRAHALARRRVVVTVAKIDRLGRNLAESVRAWDELKRLGVELHSVRDGGLINEMHYNLMAVFAQEESRRIGERVRASWHYFEERGWHKPGRAAWGYRYRPATAEDRAAGAPQAVLETAEDETGYVRELWSRYVGGEGVETLVRWLAGLPDIAHGGRTLRSSTLRRLLGSPVYIGRVGSPHNIGECAATGERCPLLALPVGRWEPLIDDETWERAHHQAGRMRRMPAQASGVFVLTGLLRCPSCGARMVGNSGDRSRSERSRKKYMCSGRRAGGTLERRDPCYRTVPGRQIEEAVLLTAREIIKSAADPALRAEMRASAARSERERDRDPDDAAGRVRRLEGELARARKMLSAASQKFFADEISRVAYDVTSADLSEQIESVTAELERERGRARKTAVMPVETLFRVADGWQAILDRTEQPSWRAVLGELFERVMPVRVGYGKYEAGVELTALGRGLVSYVCAVAPSANLVAVRTLGKTNVLTATHSPRAAGA